MARLIFISPYLKGGKNAKWLRNRTRYFATREGVVIPKKNADAPPTEKQKAYIQRLTRSLPLCRELLEYEDYRLNPTRRTAAEFITQAYEQFIVPMDKRENYIDYVANRPGAQQVNGHGLWDANGSVGSLHQVEETVAAHAGNVWTPIVSLRREDAERLGYTDAENWRSLVCACVGDIAAAYKIHPDNLKWYAALHTKENHIHIHMILYSEDPKEGFLTKNGIQQVKSAFVTRIYQQDRISIYEKQTQYRNRLRDDAEAKLVELIRQMQNGTLQNERVEQLMGELAQRLPLTKGRKVYGYLPPRIKSIVNEVVDELAKDERIAEAYEIWQELQEQKCLDYNRQLPERVPLSQQKEFKVVRNMVVREALKLSEHAIVPPTTQQTEHTERTPMQERSASAFSVSEEIVVEQTAENVADNPPPDDTPPKEPKQNAAVPPPAPLKSSSYCAPPLSEALVRMLHHMGNIFRDAALRDSTYGGLQIDRKRRQELRELRGALGHPEDDHEDETLYHVNDPQTMRQ